MSGTDNAGDRDGGLEVGVGSPGRTTGRSTGASSRGRRDAAPGEGLRVYEVTYAFHGHLQGTHDAAADRVSEELSSLRAEGVDIELRGRTRRLDGAGRVTTSTVRFEAPNEGAVARLNCRALLPVCGIRRIDP